MRRENINILIVAGEPSGDIHASNLVNEIKKYTSVKLYGTGGEYLLKLGQIQYETVANMSVIGFDGVLKKIPSLLKLAYLMCNIIMINNIDIVILVDYCGFNLKFAEMLRKRYPFLPIVGFIAPQVWVWKHDRVKKLKKYFSKVLAILPFEEELLRKEGVDATYIGSPVTDNIKFKYDQKDSFVSMHNFDKNKKIVGLVPGSRLSEISYLLPLMAKTASLLSNNEYEFIVAKAPSIDNNYFYDSISGSRITVVNDETYDIMKYSDILWICSGTATLEAAIIGTPMVILYKSSWLNFQIMYKLTSLRTAGLPNIIASQMNLTPLDVTNGVLVPELLGSECTCENLLYEHNKVMSNIPFYRNNLKPIGSLFVDKNPMKNATLEIFKILDKMYI